MRAAALLLASAPLVGCVYYNGIYNARQAQTHGDAMLHAGRTAAAESLYTVAAEKAETVLVHHPTSRWAKDAQLIAGWSWAMAARCDRAEPRLTEVLTSTPLAEGQLGAASLALGVCRVRERRFAEARSLLAPLTGVADRRISADASMWAALASVELGERDSVRHYLRRADRRTADWVLARAYLDRGEIASAESLFARRASRGDYQDGLLDALRTLWRGGRADVVTRIAGAYDAGHASMEDRARVHLLVGMLALRSGDDSLARAHLADAVRLSRDSALVRDAEVRLTMVELRGLTSVVDVANVIARGRALARGSPLQRRLDANLLLVQMLSERDDDSGASLFLAAEVARDSLHAPALARALFSQVAELPQSPLAAMSLAAAARLPTDAGETGAAKSGAASEGALVAGASFGDLSGRDPIARRAAAGGVDPLAALLDRTWTTVTAQYADSLRRLRPDTVEVGAPGVGVAPATGGTPSAGRAPGASGVAGAPSPAPRPGVAGVPDADSLPPTGGRR